MRFHRLQYIIQAVTDCNCKVRKTACIVPPDTGRPDSQRRSAQGLLSKAGEVFRNAASESTGAACCPPQAGTNPAKSKISGM
jgi:hypothetical protein